MRVYGMLLGALLAAAGMTTSAGAVWANPSTITSVDIARAQPVGSYAGLTFRYIEGAINGEVSAEEPIAGLRALAAGQTTVPYRVTFHIIAPEAASEADAVVVEAPNRGRTIFPNAIGIAAAVAGQNARSGRKRHGRRLPPEPQDLRRRNPMANGVHRRRVPERARDR